MATAAALAFVQKLYVAYYQRPADYAGQQYWAEKFDKEGGASAIANAFATSAESVTLYGTQALAAQISAVYQASFGRAAETAGLQFYLNEISAGRMTVGTMAVSVLNGAAGADLTVLNAKLAVAAAYTTAASDATGILKYAGTAAADIARTFLTAVVSVATQTSQTALITANLNSIVAQGTAFTLTTGIDSFTGTAGSDSFSSTAVGGFGALDSLDGGAGTDVLTVSDTTAIATSTSQVVKNIETVTLSSSAGVTADMTAWTGLTKATINGVGAMTITAADTANVSVATSGAGNVAVIGTGGDLAVVAGTGNVTIGGTAVANKLASVSVTNGAAVAVTDRSGTAAATGSTLKTVTVSGATGASTITGDGVTTLNLTNLNAATTVNNVTLTAAAATRALVLNLNGVDEGAAGTDAGTTVVTDAEATSLTINATGSRSFDVTATTAKAVSLAVKADVDLQMDALGSAVSTTLNVSGAGKFTADAQTLTAAGVITSTSTGGVILTTALGAGQQFVGTSSTGADTITVAASTVAHTTGAGNDTVTAGIMGTGGSVNGGDGTDILSIASATAVAVTVTTVANAANYTNFETLRLNDGLGASIDATKLVGVNAINVHGAVTTGSTVTLNTGNTVGLGADSGGTIGFTATPAVNTNALTLNTNGWDVTGLITTTGVGTLNLSSGTATVAVANSATVLGLAFDAATLTGGLTMAGLSGGTLGTINLTGSNAITFGAAISGASVINASALTGALTMFATGAVTASITATGGSGNDVLVGSTVADTLVGGAGNDTLANRVTGANTTTADSLTGGTGADNFVLRGDTATGAVSTVIGTVSRVMDFTIGTSAATSDVLNLSATSGNYANAATGLNSTVAAAAASSTVVQSVAVNASAAAITAGADLIKLTTGGTTTGTLQAAFDAAIGTSTVTGLTAGNEIFVSLYDTTNSRMLILVADAGAGTNTILETGDVVSLVGSIDMTAADYVLFTNANLAIIAA
ncbi:DUF4214 domain-containing protein [Janthinobacterium sp. B9-8]|uniref:DUF4214 domain-containing protein n=1 Tax=Janthinobacterium sp. B9-8 TaxID=1236179 RepID=UPI00061D30F2|nr:DUF4214 domain-containing protein [Janthinobacterium sp. B9-8]AMC35796.1 hypothetical protein VN23_14840 [Janthinobacterium sp. B9-8]